MNNREIEVKYVLHDWKLLALGRRIQSLPFLLIEKYVDNCFTKDFYFPGNDKIQTIRLRDSYGIDNHGFSKQLKEITVKSKDQGNNFNRLEENIEIEDCLPAFRSLQLLFGDPVVTLEKQELVYWSTNGLVISLAQVNNSEEIYLEIEGPSEKQVLQYCDRFEQEFTMVKETRSLLEIQLDLSALRNE